MPTAPPLFGVCRDIQPAIFSAGKSFDAWSRIARDLDARVAECRGEEKNCNGAVKKNRVTGGLRGLPSSNALAVLAVEGVVHVVFAAHLREADQVSRKRSLLMTS
jgi:hypothetical protein